mmetsp:Transcript_21467/g.40899  ORF Transcript_21467/g.40899 Transcript_21467/m.40899 type:complete len:957 (-) Transcript_21467:262-3132(-)
MFSGQWGARRWSDLVGCVLADKYVLQKCLEAVRGSCGCPFICDDLQTGTTVFIKILDGSDYTLNREVAEVEAMVKMGLNHQNLVDMISVVRNGTVVRRVEGQKSGEVRAQGVTAIVSQNAPGGDLFDYLFAPVNTGRPKPCSFPEAMSRHFIRQLIDGVLFLHGHEIYHRDLKPENVVFDDSYNAMITDFGMNSFTPAEATEFPRAQTMHVPTDDRKWTVGTEAYAPPEVRGASVGDHYDPAAYDSWSLGMVLLMMLGVDKLEVVTHQLMRGQQIVKEKVVRMPFVGYRTTSGDRPNMLSKLDNCPPGFKGDLDQKAPEHRHFWAQFPALASSLSPSARDLINRVFVREPHKRITLSMMLKHPWFSEATNISPELIKQEMMARQPQKKQTGTNQTVYLGGGGNDAGISQAELRRNLKMGADSSGNVTFPRDKMIASNVGFFDCGPAGEYSASKLFAGISQSVTSWGLRQPEGMLSKSMLALTAFSEREFNNTEGEEFQIEVIVSDNRVKVLMRNFPVSTRWHHWREEIELFCANYCSMVEKSLGVVSENTKNVNTTAHPGHIKDTATPMEMESASVGETDWWPECTAEEQQQYKLLWSMFGQPMDGHLRKDMFLRYMERTSGMMPVEVEAVWHLVVPQGASMKQSHFVNARYLITRMLEGRTLPTKFPQYVIDGKSAKPNSIGSSVGTKEHPFRYDIFAYLFRPLLEQEYRKVNRVWRKFAPIAVLCPNGISPFSSGVVVEGDKQKWTVCNICTPQMESWGIKSANLFSNYTIPPNDLQIGLDLLEPSKSHAGLESLTLNVTRSLPGDLFRTFGPDTWRKMQSTLRDLTLTLDNTEGATWRFAIPTNTVVALPLAPPEAPDMLKRILGAVGISYFGGPLYREETYKPAEVFGPDYYLVSDVGPSLNLFGLSDMMPGRNQTHDKQWVWKNTNKVFRGQTLITRTIHKDTFLATYRQE